MTATKNVLNGTLENLGGIGVTATLSDESNVNVSVYMSALDKYKTEFGLWSKKTAQATLEMCRVVCEAKKELESQKFLKFCNAIGRKGEDATVRKYLRIGEKYENLYQYAEMLPNSWTSIYEITQLPSDVFDTLVTTENSMANMTGDQLKLLMGKKTKPNFLSSAATAPAPTAQTATEAPKAIDAGFSKKDESNAVTASSDATMVDSIETGTAQLSAADEKSMAQSLSESDRDFAKQATSTMLERVAATALTAVDVEYYEITIRFNKKPSHEAIETLVESILKIKSKHRLGIEIMSDIDHAV
jgi:hypothetical protein